MKRAHLDCSCHSLTHLVRFDIDSDPKCPFFCITYHLNNERGFWQRLVEAVRHVFGKGERYGSWDETLLEEKQVAVLRDLCDEYLQLMQKPPGERISD